MLLYSHEFCGYLFYTLFFREFYILKSLNLTIVNLFIIYSFWSFSRNLIVLDYHIIDLRTTTQVKFDITF